MTVEKIIPCICCEHPPSVDDSHTYGMPFLIPCNSSRETHKQWWEAICPNCKRGGLFQYKSAYLALKAWNEMQQKLYEWENKQILYEEAWKDTCERLGMTYHEGEFD